MTISFYKHQDIHDSNESEALTSIAKTLYRHFYGETKHLIVVANIQPNQTNAIGADFPDPTLPQIDLVLLGEEFVSLIDIKTYRQPIVGKINKSWYVKNNNTKYRTVTVNSGSKRNKNPYEQVERARNRWRRYFEEQSRQSNAHFAWHHLASCILFFPFLHPDSTIQKDEEKKWLHVISAGEVHDYAFNRTSEIRLTRDQMHIIATDWLHAKPWSALERHIQSPVGILEIQRRGISAREPLYRDETLSIGRSSRNQVVIDELYEKVSRVHLELSIDLQRNVLFKTLGQRTYRQRPDHALERLKKGETHHLQYGDTLLLGGKSGSRICKVHYRIPPPPIKGGHSITRVYTSSD